MSNPHTLALSGACHWCTEGIFVSLRGVTKVEQGWVAAPPPDDDFAEGIIVHYDPAIITAADLIGVHLETHSATGNHQLRHRYRSAVYFMRPEDEVPFSLIIDGLRADFDAPLLTQVLPFTAFRPSPPEYQDYYRTDPERPFCQRYITPKLDQLRKRRPNIVRDGF